MMATIRQPLVLQALRVGATRQIDSRLAQQVLGLTFDNPIGLAAGLDKQGVAAAAWGAIGFGSTEIGTVTPLPQPGNPKPRIFRLPDDGAIINRLGFNSAGASVVAQNLRDAPKTTIRVGINIGRNKDTTNERAAGDYVSAAAALHEFADYFVVNVSSPNTAGLRDLQERQAMRSLLEQVVTCVRTVSPARLVPVLVKVSPDLAQQDLLAAVDAAMEGGATGVIATNTTISRDGLRTQTAAAGEAGGLSGAPLRHKANEACRLLFTHLTSRRGGPRVPIVGVGGISNADHAYERIRAGASLVQLYTGLIYEGPGVVLRIVRGLSARLKRDGFNNISEATGIDADG